MTEEKKKRGRPRKPPQALPPASPAPIPLQIDAEGKVQELFLAPLKIRFPVDAIKALKKEAIDRGTHVGAILYERFIMTSPPIVVTRH